MKIFYCDTFVLPRPESHRFPMAKYALLRQAVATADFAPGVELRVPAAATDRDLLRVHEASYLERVKSGSLSARQLRQIGFPWSPQLVERSRRSAGGTLAAARAALGAGASSRPGSARPPARTGGGTVGPGQNSGTEARDSGAAGDGVAVNLAGGTHHAFADRGQGFCVFNDAAVAARAVQAEGLARRVLVVDCDVHQGDGTAAIFRHDPTVFTFSVHGRQNFPFRKERSDLDVELEDGAGDDEYLEALAAGLDRAIAAADADLAVYLAGADPFAGDRLGRLALSRAGLERRDRLVLAACRRAGLAVAVVMAGGYAEVEDVVAIHLATVRAAAEAGGVL